MFIIGNFLNAVAFVLNMVLEFFFWIVIARAVLSWVSPDPYNPIVRFINNATEPVLSRIRSLVPAVMGGIDFTPIIVIICIKFIQIFIVNSLYGLARTMS